jgi:hypothetical protein
MYTMMRPTGGQLLTEAKTTPHVIACWLVLQLLLLLLSTQSTRKHSNGFNKWHTGTGK